MGKKMIEKDSKGEAVVIDGETGEVMDDSRATPELDKEAALSLLNDKDALARIQAVSKAKDDAFVALESDFWKPTKPGDELRGIYLGSGKDGRYVVHVIGKLDKETGKPIAVRINGTHVLTRELPRGTPGQGVRITFQGTEKASDDRKINKYEVAWLKNA
jgi:hypothetical protein